MSKKCSWAWNSDAPLHPIRLQRLVPAPALLTQQVGWIVRRDSAVMITFFPAKTRCADLFESATGLLQGFE